MLEATLEEHNEGVFKNNIVFKKIHGVFDPKHSKTQEGEAVGTMLGLPVTLSDNCNEWNVIEFELGL